MKFSSLAIAVVLAVTTSQLQSTEAFTSVLNPQAHGTSSLLKASTQERDAENFQRRLLATRLKQNSSGENVRSDGSDDKKNDGVLLEDADGLGVASESTASAAQEPAPVEAEDESTAESVVLLNGSVADADEVEKLMSDIEIESEKIVAEIVEEECQIDEETLGPVDPLCADEEQAAGFRAGLKNRISNTLQSLRGISKGDKASDEEEEEEEIDGDMLEEGWFKRGESSALRRNAEVWKFALKCVFRSLKPRSMKKKGASEEEIKQAQIDAATFIRDGLLKLGPTFVKLGQVVSTRTDVLPKTFTDVLKTLQDDVPPFSGARAKEIIAKELGAPTDEIFTDFSETPLKAASLGQVHTAYYKGKKVAIKVQRAGLKELFDVDLKNLRKLAVLLDKFDPKSDGADRDWVSIYEESERLLYLEIDYLNEADNGERFAKDFKNIDYVRVPEFYRDLSTPRVLTMEFVESLKLTDIEKIESLGLDRELLAKRTADAFLRQIVETSYFRE